MFNQTPIGTLGGQSAKANGIGPSGEVVGWAEDTNGRFHAFLFDQNGILDLGIAPLFVPAAFTGFTFERSVANAVAISPVGEIFIAGTSQIWTISNPPSPIPGDILVAERATLFRVTTGSIIAEDLGTLTMPVSLGGSRAFGVNSAGQVVGAADTSPGGGPRQACLYASTQNPPMISLGTLDWDPALGVFRGNSEALAINDNGQIVGVSDTGQVDSNGNEIRHAFLFETSSMTMMDLGTLLDWVQPPEPHLHSTATAINNAGQIVGWSSSFDSSRTRVEKRAFLYDPSIVGGRFMWDIGTLDAANRGGTFRDRGESQAFGINDSVAVVGSANINAQEVHAFRRDTFPGAFPIDIQGEININPGYTAVRASGINNQGQICVTVDGAGWSAFLLTP